MNRSECVTDTKVWERTRQTIGQQSVATPRWVKDRVRQIKSNDQVFPRDPYAGTRSNTYFPIDSPGTKLA